MLLMYFKETFVIAIYTFISVIISSLGLVAKGKSVQLSLCTFCLVLCCFTTCSLCLSYRLAMLQS